MLSQELEDTLRRALALAGEHAHEFATLEHLLLAMLDDNDALAVLVGCNVDVEELKDMLNAHIEEELSSIVSTAEELEVQPTSGFQRVVQRAIIHTSHLKKALQQARMYWWRCSLSVKATLSGS